eukprot:Plantae.Rhodophyta-Palmaria_palmata.ctg13863.p1 GENE.Plantae.Rhodophyta-Palmaria_palmata.ctg13863~~Plantae.Rhodophyta-Palmaria_palmata.ctg13863.p1  ORF type:complete len:123 (-),score=21.05 Plantae.Rhodophyta-Palmaria_palmata.ctg13863:114-482(-)
MRSDTQADLKPKEDSAETNVDPEVAKYRAMEDAIAKDPSAKSCVGCHGKFFFEISGRSKDCNWLTYPCGKSLEGYGPSFTGVSDLDGANIKLCIACGRLANFDAAVFRKELDNAYRIGAVSD